MSRVMEEDEKESFMGEGEIEVIQEVVPAEPRNRSGVGLLGAFLLHQSIFAIGTALTAIVEKTTGVSSLFQNSPYSLAWLAGWLGVTRFFLGRKKPRLKELIPFLALFTSGWFLIAFVSTMVRLDTPEEQTEGVFTAAMFLAYGATLGLAIVFREAKPALGDWYQMKVAFQRSLGEVFPRFHRYRGAPEDILTRISAAAETTPEIVWQRDPEEITPFLPDGRPKDPEVYISIGTDTNMNSEKDCSVKHRQ